jgi:hypothetical protein
MHANYTKRTNIWKFLTPLDSTHLEVFLRILWDFFYFLNSNSNFEFGPVGNWPEPEPVRTGRTGSHRFGWPCRWVCFCLPVSSSCHRIWAIHTCSWSSQAAKHVIVLQACSSFHGAWPTLAWTWLRQWRVQFDIFWIAKKRISFYLVRVYILQIFEYMARQFINNLIGVLIPPAPGLRRP